MAIASSLLVLLMAATFVLLSGAAIGLRNSAKVSSRSEVILATSNRTERLVIDLETGQRGYVITRDDNFLQPWNAARTALPGEAATLRRLAEGAGPDQGKRAAAIERDLTSYLRDYSIPIVNTAQRDPGYTMPAATAVKGKQRVDALRAQFHRFNIRQREIRTIHNKRSLSDSRRATVIAAAAAASSLLLIFLFAFYLTRALVRPVRRASVIAGDLASGDLGVRMPETSAVGEINLLERSFNFMASSLEKRRDRLRQVAEEQRALRRVATLVARGASPQAIFGAVAGELGRILRADYMVISRFDRDRMATVIGAWKEPGNPEPVPPIGSRWSLEGMRSAEARVLRTGRPARVTDYHRTTSGIGVWARTRGIESGVGSPIVVEGRLWGAMIAFSVSSEPQPKDTEQHMLEFTELVGTAIANTESRAKLTAARARLVAATDDIRRRIERDLHDGAQQRLVSLGLELRSAEVTVPPGQDALKEQLSNAARGLTEALQDLQEISRGLHPAILSKGGLAPALKSLARRCAVPVEINLHADRRLAEPLEMAIYYIVSEAVTNAIKQAHASTVSVELHVQDEVIRLSLDHDGTGCDLGGEAGLIGLKDRVTALGGKIQVASPAGNGTSLLVTIPIGIADHRSHASANAASPGPVHREGPEPWNR